MTDGGLRDAARAMRSSLDAGADTADRDSGALVSDAHGVADVDVFGVVKLYPTVEAGREWELPDDAEYASSEWNVETNPVTRVSAGVFHTAGNNGETRLTVGSPSGKAWWRNVELTGYYRYVGPMDSNGQERHWELLARSERHSAVPTTGASINAGVPAPVGTVTWPGYPYDGAASIDSHCLGSSYHGNFYLTGHGLFEKEVSHSGGYASQRAETPATDFANPQGRWFGLKFVLRNHASNANAHLELWLDANADGNWRILTQTEDLGAWSANNSSIDGCAAAPFSYATDQPIIWAGPWVVFRSDSIALDFRWLSAREIAPLP